MNKRKAKNEVLENDRTFAEYSKLVSAFKLSSKQSTVNKNIPREKIIDIYEGFLATKKPDEIPVVETCNLRGKMIMTGTGVGLVNILRDCA